MGWQYWGKHNHITSNDNFYLFKINCAYKEKEEKNVSKCVIINICTAVLSYITDFIARLIFFLIMATSVSQEVNYDFIELIEKLTVMIRERVNISTIFLALDKVSSRTLCRMFNRCGDTLLQTSIINDNKETFDFLLPFYDIIDLEAQNGKRQTALSLAIKCCKFDVGNREHYAVELINRGAFIHTVCNNNEGTYLHLAVMSSSIKIARLLLENGIDVNFQDVGGNTALHKILMCNDEQFKVDELVAVLMYYNVDPFIADDKGYIPFEYAVKYDHKVSLQESLFLYTFDRYTNYRINIETVIQLAKSKSPMFYEIFKFDIDCFVDSNNFVPDFDVFDSLLDIESDRLDILARKCSSALTKIISPKVTRFPELYRIEIFNKPMRKFVVLTSKKGMNNLNILLESEAKTRIISVLKNLKSYDVFKTAVEHNNEEDATEILTYLLSYGLCFGDSEYHTVYDSFGYCDLLKLMLHIGLRMPFTRRRSTNSIMPLLMYDINMSLEDIFQLPRPYLMFSSGDDYDYLIMTFGRGFLQTNIIELIYYFAHPKLADFLMNHQGEGKFSEETLTRIKQHPKVPLLVEMARNAYRKHLIKEFKISNTSHFYTIVNRLPISHVHKKIITYETKLY